MMDAFRSDIPHPPESMHSLSCDNTHHMDELSKEKEEELLYGTGGDEEDALSDDSMHLRLSDDDEIEADVLTPVLDNQENKQKNNEIEMTSRKDDDMQISTVPAKKIMKNDTTLNETKQEELPSGNVSMDEKIVFDYETDVQKNESKLIVQRPWPNYESQWRFSRSPGARSFRSVNHHSYNRCRYLTPRGHFRPQLYEYNVRFHNAFLPFERGRGNGMFNSYSRPMYSKRQPKKGFKPSILQRISSSTEFDQTSASPSKTSISSKTDVINSNRNVNNSDGTATEKSNVLQTMPLINDEDPSNMLPNEKVEESAIKNSHRETFDGNDSTNHTLKLHHDLEHSTKIIVSNDTECKDITATRISSLNDSSAEKLVKSVVNSHESKQTHKMCTGDINNTNFDSSDLCVSNNSENVGAYNLGIKCKSEKDEIVDKIGNHNMRNQKGVEPDRNINLNVTEHKGDKVMHNVENREFDINTKSVEGNYEIKLLEKKCSPAVLDVSKDDVAVNDESILNGKLIHDKTQEILVNKEEKVSSQTKKTNESHEGSALKATCIVLNDMTENKDDNEIRVIPSDILINSVISNEKCDKNQLKNSGNTTSYSKTRKLTDHENATTKLGLQQQNKEAVTKNLQSVEKENAVKNSSNKTAHLSENADLPLGESSLSNVKPQLCSLTDLKENNGNTDKRTIEVPVATQRRRRRTKKMIAAAEETAAEEDKQVRESGRQKRRTAKNAEEIIRKKFLNHDSDLESSDGSEKFVAVNYKMNQDARPLSPPSLKRNYSDSDNAVVNGTIKRVKIRSEAPSNDMTTKDNNSENVKKLNYIHKFFQRDLNEKLPKLKQEELEELLIQKIVETITMRDEIGKLREQARISERNQEITRAKCQQLAKQIKDFEMVLNRNAADRRANNDKPTPPIKINRSVGLQVNFITDHGMQNLRQLQQSSNMKTLHISSNNLTPNISSNETNNASSPRKGIKVRSPRRSEIMSGQTSVVSQNNTSSPNIVSTVTPAALVVAKPVDAQHSLTISNQSNVQHIMPNQQQSQQAIVLNGKFPNQINRQGSTAVNVAKPRTNDLIDLTDEEEKSKASSVPVITTTITEQVNLAQKTQPCFQRVIQTIPGNVSITSQPPSIRVVQPASQPTPTALVNNMNAPRLAYVMQSGVGPTRQLLIAPNSNPMRPVTSCRASFSALTYKTGISTIANETVRVLTTPAASSVQLNKHPAPLPDTYVSNYSVSNYGVDPLWKLPPPAPSLKISKVANGIILSWNMNLTDKYADIASYQLYAYQEIAGVPPNTSLWKKVGDVRALPLPMACTLTQFSEGNNYYFAVRAVDTHSRKGQYSIPGNISL